MCGKQILKEEWPTIHELPWFAKAKEFLGSAIGLATSSHGEVSPPASYAKQFAIEVPGRPLDLSAVQQQADEPTVKQNSFGRREK
jgi:hypothetical protein